MFFLVTEFLLMKSIHTWVTSELSTKSYISCSYQLSEPSEEKTAFFKYLAVLELRQSHLVSKKIWTWPVSVSLYSFMTPDIYGQEKMEKTLFMKEKKVFKISSASFHKIAGIYIANIFKEFGFKLSVKPTNSENNAGLFAELRNKSAEVLLEIGTEKETVCHFLNDEEKFEEVLATLYSAEDLEERISLEETFAICTGERVKSFEIAIKKENEWDVTSTDLIPLDELSIVKQVDERFAEAFVVLERKFKGNASDEVSSVFVKIGENNVNVKGFITKREGIEVLQCEVVNK